MSPYIDQVGENLADCASAWRMATTYAGEAIRDLDGRLNLGDDWRLDVNDEKVDRSIVSASRHAA